MVCVAWAAIVWHHFTGAALTYSLWSRGRLLGHSDLRWGIGTAMPGCRYGFLEYLEGAESLLDIAAAVEKAQLAVDDSPNDKTAAADLTAARDRAMALELELRGPDGRVLETSAIEIRESSYVVDCDDQAFDDTELVDELCEELDPDDDFFEHETAEQRFEPELANAALLDSFDNEEPTSSIDDESMRYLLTVTLVNPADYPLTNVE